MLSSWVDLAGDLAGLANTLLLVLVHHRMSPMRSADQRTSAVEAPIKVGRLVIPPDVEPPGELVDAVREFWPQREWQNALDISWLESNFNAFALNDSTSPDKPCGTPLGTINGVQIAAERSVGYFQVNSCNFPDWEWQRLYNARHNAGTAHLLWEEAGGSWKPWFFSASSLGLI